MTTIELQGVDVHIAGRSILSGLDLTASAGEQLVIVGANGAGKSTLLNVVSGARRPTRGKVWLFGHDPAAGRHRLVERIGHAPQRPGFDPEMTGMQTIRTISRLDGKNWQRTHAPRLLRELALDRPLEEPLGSWSHGQRQKLSLAIALMYDRDILLLDEPLAGLDPPARGVIVQETIERARQGATIVWVAHDAPREVLDRARPLSIQSGQLSEILAATLKTWGDMPLKVKFAVELAPAERTALSAAGALCGWLGDRTVIAPTTAVEALLLQAPGGVRPVVEPASLAEVEQCLRHSSS